MRFKFDEVDKYGSQGNGGYFSLKNDKDVARVRFMYNSIEDVDGQAVHAVEIDGRTRYVACKRAYNEPLDECPFCAKGMPVQAKLFVPLYNVDEEKVQVWERGKTFFSKLSSICMRYASDTNLVNHIFEIERNGKAGDTKTTYEIYEVEKDNTELEDLPEFAGLNNIVLDKSVEEMENFIENGSFDDNSAVRRRGGNREESDRSEGRRTPANRSGRDRF